MNSPEWQASIEASYEPNPQSPLQFEAPGPATGENAEAAFTSKYHTLVSRAYLQLIHEAERADARIKAAYDQLQSESNTNSRGVDNDFKEELELAAQRFHAHRQMLVGLRSWNALEEYGSDDLEFFERENRDEAYSMHRRGEEDQSIVRFLVYKLADLYHFEEANREQ